MAFLAEWYSPRVRSIEQVEAIISAPILGAIPRMNISDPAARYRAAMLEPAGVCAEAYRMVRTSFLGRNRGRCKTIAVTSAAAQEGKSTVAHNLAIVLAQTGQRVLLIDADMRNSAQHSLFESPETPGLSDVLDCTAELHRVIMPGTKLAPDIIPAGRAPENPAEMLNSPLFGEAIHLCADAYDFIVIDTPPVGCVADARIISALCDKTILVIRAEQSNPRSCAAAFQSLQLVGADVGGVVINDVQHGAFSGYGINEPYPYRAPSVADTSVERVPPTHERPRAVLGNKPLAG
jgi:capsular exopolysaccharide synthesis family protein